MNRINNFIKTFSDIDIQWSSIKYILMAILLDPKWNTTYLIKAHRLAKKENKVDKTQLEARADEAINILEALYAELLQIDQSKEEISTQIDNIKMDTEIAVASQEERVSYIPKLVKQQLANDARYQTLVTNHQQLIWDARKKTDEISIARLRAWLRTNLCA